MKVNRLQQLKWKMIKWKEGIFPICLVIIVLSAVLFIVSYYFLKKGSLGYELSFALFTGIIASTIVTLIITNKQEKELAKKKKALLFDAGFFLVNFERKYFEYAKNMPESFDEKIKQLYWLCIEPKTIITDLYKSHPELFDLEEIKFIRTIDRTIYFLDKLLKSELSDEVINEFFSDGLGEGSIGMQEYWSMINKVKENLFYLKIKWEFDKII